MVYALANVVRQSNENRKEIGCERLKNFDRLFACNFGPLCFTVFSCLHGRALFALLFAFSFCDAVAVSKRSLLVPLTAVVEIIISMCFLLPLHVMPFFIRSTHVYRSFVPFMCVVGCFFFRSSVLFVATSFGFDHFRGIFLQR